MIHADEVAARFLNAANAEQWDRVVADIHPTVIRRLRVEALTQIAAVFELRSRHEAVGTSMTGLVLQAEDSAALRDRYADKPAFPIPDAPTIGALAEMAPEAFLCRYFAGCASSRPRNLLGVVPFGEAAAFGVWISESVPEARTDSQEATGDDFGPPHPECIYLHRADGRWWAIPDRWMMFFFPLRPDDVDEAAKVLPPHPT